jgi:hypothetical protein
LEIEKDADGMRQHLTNQAMLKMPEIMYTTPRDGKAFCQMRSHGLDTLAQAFARRQQTWAGGRGHAFAGRRDDHDTVSLGSQRLTERINEAFVRRTCEKFAVDFHGDHFFVAQRWGKFPVTQPVQGFEGLIVLANQAVHRDDKIVAIHGRLLC